ncbi:MAG: hypothetical protein Q8K32_23290 [Archangium sp.]|nr:hypothetical protein [Archangium sp.]
MKGLPGHLPASGGRGQRGPQRAGLRDGLSGAFSPDGGSLCVAPVAEGQRATGTAPVSRSRPPARHA